MGEPRITSNMLRVLKVLLRNVNGENYAFDLSKTARVNVGTIYALLARLEQQQLVTSDLEGIDPAVAGRPQRRFYRLTGTGIRFAEKSLQQELQLYGAVGAAHA